MPNALDLNKKLKELKGSTSKVDEYQYTGDVIDERLMGLKETFARMGLRNAVQDLNNIAEGIGRGGNVRKMIDTFVYGYSGDLDNDDKRFLLSLR